MNKPRLIVAEQTHRSGLDSVTWEQRRRMTAQELIELMGSLWVNHPQFKARPRTLLPMPNLAGVQPMISEHHMSFWKLIRQTIKFALA